MTHVPDSPLSAARDRVVDVLKRNFANANLTEVGLEARLQRVYAATVPSELDAIIADLPAYPASGRAPNPLGQPPSWRIVALLSGQERKLGGVVPRELTLQARLGYVELDLTHAAFEPGVTTIDVRALMGYVQIRFPHGVRVESVGRALFGFFSLKDTGAGRAGDTGAPARAAPHSVVRITGRATFGFAEGFIGPERGGSDVD